MIYEDESDLLEEVIYQGNTSVALDRREILQDELEQAIERIDLSEEILNRVDRFFNTRTKQRCRQHLNSSVSSCGCSESKEIEVEIHQIDIERFLSEWIETIEDREFFNSIEKIEDENNPVVECVLGKEESGADKDTIRFVCFFDEYELDEYSFNPVSLEFGVSFFGPYPDDNVYLWSGFFQDKFREKISKEVSNRIELIGRDFCEYGRVKEFRGSIRSSLKGYFRENGFEADEEFSDICSEEIVKYNLESSKIDFVAWDTDTVYIICHCDRSHGWHIHCFRDGRIRSTRNVDVITNLRNQMSDKVENRIQISRDKSNSSNFVKVLSAFFSLGFFVLLSERFFSLVTGAAQETGLSEYSTPVISFLFISNAIAVLILACVIIGPYYRYQRFSWDI